MIFLQSKETGSPLGEVYQDWIHFQMGYGVGDSTYGLLDNYINALFESWLVKTTETTVTSSVKTVLENNIKITLEDQVSEITEEIID